MVDVVGLLLKPMDGKIKRAVYQSRKPIQQIIYFLINYNALKHEFCELKGIFNNKKAEVQ